MQPKSHETEKPVGVAYGQDIVPVDENAIYERQIFHRTTKQMRLRVYHFRCFVISEMEDLNMSVRNEIKAQIIRAGYTMQEVVDLLHEEYDWSDSVSNLSAKLQRESIRYKEVMELADVLGYDLVWVKRRDER